MIEDLNNKDLTAFFGAILAAVLDYFVHHPATAITTVVMLLITWERYKARRFKTKQSKLRADREEVELNKAKLRERDLIRRMRIQDEEDQKIKKENEDD